MSIALDGNGNSVPPEKSARAVPVAIPTEEFIVKQLYRCSIDNRVAGHVLLRVPDYLWNMIKESCLKPSE